MKHFYLLLLFALCFATSATAQDTIMLVNKRTIACKVTEVGNIDVKYTVSDSSGGISFSVDIKSIEEIRFANGTVRKINIENVSDADDYYKNQRKKAIKVDLFSPVLGHLTLAYERSIKPGRSYEIALGLIGIGKRTPDDQPNGLFAKGGYKFLYSTDYNERNNHYPHLLGGSYVKPEIIIGIYNKRSDFNYGTNKYNVTYAAALLNFGKQVVLDNSICLDIYMGVGYGMASITKRSGTLTTKNYDNYRPEISSHGVLASHGGVIAVSGGFKVGILLK